MAKDWNAWHEPYDDPSSFLSERLAVVQHQIRAVLDRAPVGPVRVISICAGQGRDLVGALAGHARRGDVTARLVELDTRNVEVAQGLAAEAGLSGIEVVAGDASLATAYRGAVPADLVLACGIFGNIVDDDVARTIASLGQLCAPDATVIWTRHRFAPDLTPAIRGWFSDAGFAELAFSSPGEDAFAVGVHRLLTPPGHLSDAPERLFTFVGYEAIVTDRGGKRDG